MADCGSDHDFSGHFCINKECPLYGRKGSGNIHLKGHGGKDRKIHELFCVNCGKAFSENNGTPFYRTRVSRETVVDIVQHLLEGCGVRATARLLKLHINTVLRCLRLVADHVVQVLNSLLTNLGCQEIQMDEFWAFVNKKEKNATKAEKTEQKFGDRWVHLAMDAVTRLIVEWKVDRRTQQATTELVSGVVGKLEQPQDALYTSDKHDPYLVALEQVIKAWMQGQTPGSAGAPNQGLEGLVSQDWLYATVKKTYKEGRCVQVERMLEIGTPERLQQRLDESPVSSKVNTSFVERLNNTFRQACNRVTRKTLGFSKDADFLEAHVILQIVDYNLVRPHGGLTQSEKRDDASVNVRRTPAMAAGLATAPWTYAGLLTHKVSPLGAGMAA